MLLILGFHVVEPLLRVVALTKWPIMPKLGSRRTKINLTRRAFTQWKGHAYRRITSFSVSLKTSGKTHTNCGQGRF
jgi:hypothetical protein